MSLYSSLCGANFLRYADQLTSAEIHTQLVDREFDEAARVLQMIAQTPEERAHYEARQKFLRDRAAQIEHAREEGLSVGTEQGRVEGRKEGKKLGNLIGRIQLLQKLLDQEVSPDDDLAALALSTLETRASELEEQMRHEQ